MVMVPIRNPRRQEREGFIYLLKLREPGSGQWWWARTIFLERDDARRFEDEVGAGYDSSVVRRDITALSTEELEWPVYPFEVSEKAAIEL